ncbi:MAG: Nif11-like leader peptide family natural product precursor [Propionivibrio sp.]|uniref:Nif11-like leader peptide family natural product n=1 Tax=Candidatus Propionivibrio dominans TaxID=2954373 RepID=A0A9D7F8G9_9RHOO|nr:Nif11-like leader peptide family natural product precursor [Candidatus Propionivibrio dominans]
MKGTITDFLELVSAKPELSREFIQLAARHGFEFSLDELSDSELQGVVGGFSDAQRGSDAQLANIDMQNVLQKQQQLIQMVSNVSKTVSDTAMSVSRKIGG